jgi:predicted permease
MLLARSVARQREMAVRLSLGAGPGRVLRQLMTESVILAALGAVGGLLFAVWFWRLMMSMRPMIPQYVHFEMAFQWSILATVTLLAGGAAFVSGFFPAWRSSRTDIFSGLKSRNAAESSGRRWLNLRNVLVFQQVAASMVLLLLTGFIVVGWQRSSNRDLGFDSTNLYVMNVDPVRDGYNAGSARNFFDKLPDHLRQVPGVIDASLAQTLPLAMSSGEMMMNAKVEFAGSARSFGATRADRVGEGFFRSIGARVRSGREFTRRDETGEARVLVVNLTMAQRLWPDQPAVGQVVQLEGDTWEVVGVVDDLRSAFPLAPAMPAVYRPITPSGFATPSMHGVSALVRVAPGTDAGTLLRQAADSIDPNVTVFQVRPISEEIDQMLYLMRFATFTYGGMGLFGMVLASVGLAGVTAYALARRTHEFGIRMALGASRWNVLGLVLREGVVMIFAGTLIGLGVALAATRALGAFFDTFAQTTSMTVSDPLLLIGAPALLALVALAACYLPARRAMHIHPSEALRSE